MSKEFGMGGIVLSMPPKTESHENSADYGIDDPFHCIDRRCYL